MMMVVGIVESEDTTIVFAVHGMVDVCQIVAGDHGLPFFLITPHLVAVCGP